MGLKVDIKELVEFQNNLKKINKSLKSDFFTSASKELAARLLAKVIKRTPVGLYPASSGKVGGTLRHGWTAGNESSGAKYANSLTVSKSGGKYIIEIINPTEYASYVEFGHRKRNKKGWVEGRFMLTISENEIESIAPKVLENKLEKYLERILK